MHSRRPRRPRPTTIQATDDAVHLAIGGAGGHVSITIVGQSWLNQHQARRLRDWLTRAIEWMEARDEPKPRNLDEAVADHLRALDRCERLTAADLALRVNSPPVVRRKKR